MSYPLLELDDLRIDCEGRPVLESVTLRSSGERIGLFGQGRRVFQALAGAARVVGGSLKICGVELALARESSVFAVAEPWSPRPTMTMLDGLVLSALLGGCNRQDALSRASRAIERLGLGQLARQKLVRRSKVEQYLAGLAEAALFDPDVVVIDWPVGLLDAEAWSRYGTALSRLLQHRRWIVFVSGAARLPVERAWIGALDQLFWLENGLGVDVGTGTDELVRALVIIDAAKDQLPGDLDQVPLRFLRAEIEPRAFQGRSAFVAELPRDEFGRPNADSLLAWCDHHGLPLYRLEILDGGS